MIENFEIKGEWFLPEKRDNRVHGVLTFDPQEGTELELYGSIQGDHFFPEFKDQEIILGLTSDSKQITLINCYMTKLDSAKLVSNGESGKPSTTYSIKYLLIGLLADKIENLKFTKISSEIFNLSEWIGISGFKNQFDIEKKKNQEITIDYKLPDQIKFDIDDNTKGLFNFVADYTSNSRYQNTATINQKVEFQVILKSEKNIEDLLTYIITFQNLLILSLYKSTYLLSISISGERHIIDYGNGNIFNKNIKLFFSSSYFKLNKRPKLDLEMIFNYKTIKDNFPIIIKNWYSKYELLEPAIDLVLDQFYNDKAFTVNSFLNLAQSAETFHARLHNHTKIPKEQYKKMKENILKSVDIEDYQNWLNDQFQYGNSLNLNQRLKEITENYSNKILEKIIGDKEQFVQNVKNSRNYYTHYSKNGEKKAIKGVDLYYLSERLKILLVCAFLIEIEIDKDILAKSLDNLKSRLFNHLASWHDYE